MANIRDVFAFGKYIVPGTISIIYLLILVLPTLRWPPESNSSSIGPCLFSRELSVENIKYISEIIIASLGLGYVLGFIIYLIYTYCEDDKLRNTEAYKNFGTYIGLRDEDKAKFDSDKERKQAFYDLVCYSEVSEEIGIEKYVSIMERQWDYLHSTIVTGKWSPIIAFGLFILYIFMRLSFFWSRDGNTGNQLERYVSCIKDYYWIYLLFSISIFLFWNIVANRLKLRGLSSINAYQEMLFRIKREDICALWNKYYQNSQNKTQTERDKKKNRN